MDLFDLVRTYEIPSTVADAVDSFVESSISSWGIHHWTRSTQQGTVICTDGSEVEPKVSGDLNDDLSIASVDFALSEYYKEYPDSFAPKFSHVRVNAYLEGARMSLHRDHITSLFFLDHPLLPALKQAPKGIPVLSVVGLLKQAEEGGNFIFKLPNGEKKEFLTEARTLIVFPSIFPLMHEVTPVVKGTRISYVSWTHY